jgi:hypothetical protein
MTVPLFPPSPFPSVQHRPVEARRLLYAIQKLRPEHLGNFVNGATLALPQILAVGGARQLGPVAILYHAPVTETSDGPVEVCVPFSGELEIPDGLQERQELPHREAYLPMNKTQFGDGTLFNAARRELEEYAQANGEQIGPLRQIDFGVWAESGPDDLVGELAVPLRWLNQIRPETRGRLFP